MRIIISGLNNTSLFDWLLDITSIKPVYWYLQIILISHISFFICSLNNKLYKNRYYIWGFTGLLLFIFGGGSDPSNQSLSLPVYLYPIKK